MGFDILSGAASLAGPVLNYFSQQDTNRANTDSVNNQMKFQQYNSDTAHQREVADLKKAGLNPTLSAGGSGASTSPGASTKLDAPQVHMPDFLAYGIQQKQLENEAQKIATDKGRLANETNLSAAQIASLTEDTKSKKFQSQIADAASKALEKAKQAITAPENPESNYFYYQKPIKLNPEGKKQREKNFDDKYKKQFGALRSFQP